MANSIVESRLRGQYKWTMSGDMTYLISDRSVFDLIFSRRGITGSGTFGLCLRLLKGSDIDGLLLY